MNSRYVKFEEQKKSSYHLMVEGMNEPGKRDGSGPFVGSYQSKTKGKGKRKMAGEPCPNEVTEQVSVDMAGEVFALASVYGAKDTEIDKLIDGNLDLNEAQFVNLVSMVASLVPVGNQKRFKNQAMASFSSNESAMSDLIVAAEDALENMERSDEKSFTTIKWTKVTKAGREILKGLGLKGKDIEEGRAVIGGKGVFFFKVDGVKYKVSPDLKKASKVSESVNEKYVAKKGMKLSSSEYQKAKKSKGFNAKDWKWDPNDQLYVCIKNESILNEATDFQSDSNWTSEMNEHKHSYQVDQFGNGYTTTESGHAHEIQGFQVLAKANHRHDIPVNALGYSNKFIA